MTSHPKQPAIIWWILWFALLSSVFVTYFIIGEGTTADPRSAESSAWMIAFIPFIASVVIRWLVLPRAKNAQAALPLFVIGMAVAELSNILGVMVFPAHKLGLLLLSALGILQFVPYFASGFAEQDR